MKTKVGEEYFGSCWIDKPHNISDFVQKLDLYYFLQFLFRTLKEKILFGRGLICVDLLILALSTYFFNTYSAARSFPNLKS